MITNSDVVVIENLSLSEYDLDVCRKIAANTSNTWQRNRTEEDKLRDTCLGKFAEKALKQYLSDGCHNGLNPYIAFYDEFRIDEFKYHNSIDFLFSTQIHHLLNAQGYIQKNLSSPNAKISEVHRKAFRDGKVNIGEIKATRIPNDSKQRLRTNGQPDIAKILGDDFLAYPSFTRTSSTIHTKQDYFKEINNNTGLSVSEILEQEEKNLMDWYFRVYIDEKEEIGHCNAYIVGALPKLDFVNNFHIKKMAQQNKSESAIYLAVPFSYGMPISDFKKNEIKTTPFPNHLTAFFRGGQTVNDSLQIKKPKP